MGQAKFKPLFSALLHAVRALMIVGIVLGAFGCLITHTGSLLPKYTFGSALFVGWIGGAILFGGGILMCLACRGMVPECEQRYGPTSYKAPSQAIYKSEMRQEQIFNESNKAHGMDGRQSNQRFDYV